MVLADDLDGNGQLDLLLATMNGNLYAFQSLAPAEPEAIWPSQVFCLGQGSCSLLFPSTEIEIKQRLLYRTNLTDGGFGRQFKRQAELPVLVSPQQCSAHT